MMLVGPVMLRLPLVDQHLGRLLVRCLLGAQKAEESRWSCASWLIIVCGSDIQISGDRGLFEREKVICYRISPCLLLVRCRLIASELRS